MSTFTVDFLGKDNLSSTIDKVKRSLEDVTSKADKLDNLEIKFKKIQESAGSYQKKIRQINQLMSEMNMDGLGNSQLYVDMASAAAQYTDALGDARNATRLLSSDTAGLQASIQAFQGLASVASIATGAMGMLGVEESKTQKIMLKVLSCLAILNGLQLVQNVLNKDSILVLKLKSTWLEIERAATIKNTAATGANTIAQNGWNVAKAIGKALLYDYSGLLLLAAAGIATFAINTNKEVKVQEKFNDEVKETSRTISDDIKDINKSAASVQAQFTALVQQYTKLSSYSDKLTFLREHAEDFKSLGLAVKDVNTADEIFVKNQDAVLTALRNRARATAALNVYTKKLEEVYENFSGAEEDHAYLDVKAGSKVELSNFPILNPSDYYDKTTEYVMDIEHTYVKLTEEGARKINELRHRIENRLLENALKDVENRYGSIYEKEKKEADEANKKIADLLYKPEPKQDARTNKTQFIDFTFGGDSIKILEDALKLWEKKYKEAGTAHGRAYAQKMIDSLNEQLKNLKDPVHTLREQVENRLNQPITLATGNTLGKGPLFTDDQLDNAWELSDAFNSIASAIGQFGGKAAVFSTIASTIATLVPQVMAAASAFAALAEAKAVASSKHWIEAIAASAAVAATLVAGIAQVKNATRNKYAQGGIVPGNSYFGDHINAHVNSGEMILNKKQLANLFNMINGRSYGTGVNQNNVVFRLQGRELIGLIQNENKKMSMIL